MEFISIQNSFAILDISTEVFIPVSCGKILSSLLYYKKRTMRGTVMAATTKMVSVRML
jgi:hypothetical protein